MQKRMNDSICSCLATAKNIYISFVCSKQTLRRCACVGLSMCWRTPGLVEMILHIFPLVSEVTRKCSRPNFDIAVYSPEPLGTILGMRKSNHVTDGRWGINEFWESTCTWRPRQGVQVLILEAPVLLGSSGCCKLSRSTSRVAVPRQWPQNILGFDTNTMHATLVCPLCTARCNACMHSAVASSWPAGEELPTVNPKPTP